MKTIKTNFKLALSLALILTLTLQLFVGVPLDFSAQAAVTGSFISAVNIVNISVYSGGSEIKNGDAIPPDLMASNMSLLIDFVIPPDKLTAIHDSPNKTYEIALPAGLSWGTNLPRNIGGSFDGVYLEFAKLNASGSNLQVIFDDTLSYWTNAAYGYYDGDEIENGWIEVNVQFDATAIGEKYAYQITLTPDKVLNLYFDQHKPSTMFLGKTGNYKDNRFEWNITYVTGKIEATGPNSRDPELPVTFTDTFDPRVHTLILESLPHFNSSGFNDMETGIIYEHAGVVVNTTATATTITYTTDSPDNWGYETRISDDKLNTATATENITATNEVKVFEKDNPTALRTETASVTVGAAHRQWMGKVGKQIGREMEWTITINTNDRYLTNLVLYDKLPPGMTLVSGSITVSPTPVGTGFAINETPGGTFPNDYSFRVIFPPRGEPTSPVYASVYTVTYRTKIADTYFDNPTVGGFDSSNNAWIDFDWRYWTYGPGPGSPITFTRPSISKPSGAVTNVIQKNAMGYDRATGKITWRVTVNPHKINIASGTITDNFAALTIEHNPNNNKQTYAGGFTVQGGDTRISTTTANGASTLTVTVGAIGTDTLWFEFDTYVGVADHARNTPINRRFDNVVSFSGVLAGGTPESPILIPTTTASAWLTTTSQMMTKIGTTVTYNTTTQNPEITWTIVVNQNKMNLTGATIVDVLPLGLTYVPGSITGGGVTASASGQTLTITLPNGTETHTITYRTAIDPTNLELANAFKTTNNIDITNSATLVLGGDFSTVSPTAAATQKVANPRLNKTRITPSPVGEYNYRVDVNVNGVILNPTGVLPADRDVLIDESPPGLRLDIESVQLVRATVNANGTLSPISGDANIWKFDDIWYLYDCGDCAGCDEDDEDCTDQKEMKIFDFSDYPANFKVNLPSDNARDRYILTYTCVVAPGITVPLKNKINFAWEDIEVDDNSDTLVIGSGGGGSSNRLATITLTLQDSMRPDVKLSNVEFEVWRNIAGVEILEMTVKTGTNGQVTLYPLSPNADYTLKQVSYPDGYVADSLRYHSHNNGSGAVTVTPNNATTPTDSEMTIRVTARASDANNPTTITVTNAPATASFSFTARSDEVINIASPSGIFLPLGENQANFTARLTHVNGAATTSSTVSSVILTNLPTNASGVVTFADLPHGTYTITQNNTLQTNGVNSHTQPTSFTVIVNRDGTVTMPATPYYANNVFFRPSITVNKTGLGASDTVTFQLWDTTNSPAVQVATQTRTGNGSVIFNGLLGGHSYEIREINTIATYYQSGTHTISKINSATNLPNVAWTNYPHSASITVTLRDGDRNAILLVGNFELYDENDNMIDSGTSTGGTLTFNNLPMTQTSPYTINSAPNVLSTGYYLIQTSSPDGYTPHPDPIPVSLSTTYNTNTPVIVNNAPIKINTTLTFVKESEMGGTIAGVEFQLSDTHITLTATSNSSGIVTFTGIPFGTYTLSEKVTPEPYVPITPITVEINSSGVLTKFGEQDVSLALKVINKVSDSHIEITKLNAANDQPMQGVAFTLERKNESGGWTVVETSNTDEFGKVTFLYLYPGRDYRIIETVPTGYITPQPFEFTALLDGTITRNWYNHSIPKGSITITKTETGTAPGRNVPISGIEFTLYKGTAPIATATTDENGVAVFNNLDVDVVLTHSGSNLYHTLTINSTAYTVKETNSPGYVEDTSDHTFTLTGTTLNQTKTITNAPLVYDVTIKNVNNWRIPLEGGEFLLSDTTDTSTLTFTATGAANGSVSFTGVPHGVYEITQTKTPDDHFSNSAIYTVTVSRSGVVTTDMTHDEFVNSFSNSAGVTITLINSNTKQPIPGVTFTIKEGDDFYTYSDATDASGEVVFPGLMQERDFVIAITMPSGYQQGLMTYDITGLDADYFIDWELTPIPPAPPSLPIETTEPPEDTTEPPADNPDTMDEKIYLPQLPQGYYVVLVAENIYQVFNSDGVLIGYINVPLGIPLFDFDIMSNIISVDEYAQLSQPIEDNPRTGIPMEAIAIIPAFLIVIITKKRRMRIKP